MQTRVEIKNRAKTLLKGNYGAAMLPYLLMTILASVASGITFGIGSLIILPFTVGMYLSYYLQWKGENPPLELMFTSSVQENFLRKMGSMLLVGVYTFLWSLLFIVPGIIKGFSYAMTPFILAKFPDVDANEAIKLSRRIMHGRKMDLFFVELSFIGWNLLGIVTFGISLIFWSEPYRMLTHAGCFDEFLADALESGRISAEELYRNSGSEGTSGQTPTI